MEKIVFRLRLSIATTLFVLTVVSQAYAYTKAGKAFTTDGSQADVSAAIASATAGETVMIPAGTFTWGAAGSYVLVNKAITLTGAGPALTTITLATDAGIWTAATIRITAAAVVRGFSVIQPGSRPTTAFSCSTAHGWRITDIKYTGAPGEGYFCYIGNVYGLIDSCNITGGAGTSELIFARGPTDSWQSPASMGTAEEVIIEDCIFNGPGYVCDANSNARFVVRYCTINGTMKIDGHGLASNTPARGVRHMEIYGNNWTSTTNYWTAIELRGGSGMVFNNTAAGTNSRAWFYLTEYGSTGLWSNFGKVYQTPLDYPVTDQIGVGMDPKSDGSEPYYVWNNSKGGSVWTLSWQAIPAGAITQYQQQTANPSATFTMQDIIKTDRDYFIQGASFDGSSGIGLGPKAQMLAALPSKVGVGYWVTDEGEWNSLNPGPDGQLYAWNGTAWVLKYAPYVYPHPLRNEGILQPPTGLHIVE